MTVSQTTSPFSSAHTHSSSGDSAGQAVTRPIRVGLLGLGIVGGGVARLLQEKADAIAEEIGRPITLHRALVRDLERQRSFTLPADQITGDPAAILDDPDVDIVVEVMGGIATARDYIRRAITNGKHVVTANKDLMATHGVEILQLAQERGVDVYYEASVGGGIPLIGVFRQDLVANEMRQVHAIINGTTNYILTRMAKDGSDFGPALAEAQALGYAESDPTNDVEGIDATYKLAILASLAFRTHVAPEQIFREGITRLRAADFRYARELGYVIKLLAIGKRHKAAAGDEVEVRVHPTLVPQDFLLAGVDGVFNAVHVQGDLVGSVLFYGRGAGSEPTSSAVVADVIDVAHNLNARVANRIPFRYAGHLAVRPIEALISRYYVRLWVADQPGVLAKIAQVFGDHQISIASCLQKETDAVAGAAELVIVTHEAREADMQAALAEFAQLEELRQLANMLRIETVS